MEIQKVNKPNPGKTNLVVDAIAFVAYLIAFAPYTTDIPIHEWLGIGIGGVIVIHLLLHWDWIIKAACNLFGKMSLKKRINTILNGLFFIDTSILILSGLMISESALPAMGVAIPFTPIYFPIHSVSANLAVVILGLHVALHWKWIVKTIGRFIIKPFLKMHNQLGISSGSHEVEA